MREILFKAKRIDNGEWINGDLITTPFIRNETQENIPYILDITKADYDCFEDLSEGNGIFEVDPSTICQYTGLNDKNGKKIWENDVAYMRCNGLSGYGKVIYENGCFWIDDKKRGRKYPFSNHNVRYRVDGNIFDNPELLNG